MINVSTDEYIMFSFKSHKHIKPSNVIVNIIANIISEGIAGRVINDFELILTNENLYIEALGYWTWGGLTETLYTEKFSREDIKSFEVTNEGSEELITLTTTNDKKTTYVRDNEKKDNLGLIMAELLSKPQEN